MPRTPTTDADAYLFTLTLRNTLTDEEVEYQIKDTQAQALAAALADRVDALEIAEGAVTLTGLSVNNTTSDANYGRLVLMKAVTGGNPAEHGTPTTLPCKGMLNRITAVESELSEYEHFIRS